jgi:hypothetical protein
MKKILTLSLLLVSILTFAQVPQGISYQAIALNNSGNPVVSSNVGIRLSILDNSASGTVLYTETHTKTTNAQGLFNLVIGQGTPTVGLFTDVKWETNSKFLKEEIDVTGGTNYVLIGTTQLLSVPFAMYAGKVNSEDIVGGSDVKNVWSSIVNSSSFITDTNAYVYEPSTVSPFQFSWHSTPISGTPFMKSYNSFLTSTNVYIYDNNTWNSYPITGIPKKIISNGGSTLVVTSTNAYLHVNDGTNTTWAPISISGDIVKVSNNNSNLGVLTSTNFYICAYDSTGTTRSWISTPITGNPLNIKFVNGGIMALTSTNAYIYGQDNNDFNYSIPTFSWKMTPISGTLKLD